MNTLQGLAGLSPSMGLMREGGGSFAKSITPAITPITIVNPGFETWNSATDLNTWTESITGSSSINRESSTKRTGDYSARLDIDSANSLASISQGIPCPPYSWIRWEFWGRSSVEGRSFGGQTALYSLGSGYGQSTSEWRKNIFIGQTASILSDTIVLKRGTSTSSSMYIDDLIAYYINMSSCLRFSRAITGNFQVSTKLIVNQNTQIGVGLMIDSLSNPQNGVFVYIDKARIFFDKLVNGVMTFSVLDTVSWADGDELKVIKTGNDYAVYKNGVQRGVTKTVTDASIINNTNQCQFSTYEGNLFSTFFLAAHDGIPTRFTFIGDSITAGTTSTSWAYRVTSKFDNGYTNCINHAVGGSKVVPDEDPYQDMSSQITASSSDNADVAMFLMGTNDSVLDDTFRSNYQTNIENFKTSNPNAIVICLGILPRAYMGGITTKNALIETACENAGATYIDTSNISYGEVEFDVGVHIYDTVHLTDAGQELFANWVAYIVLPPILA